MQTIIFSLLAPLLSLFLLIMGSGLSNTFTSIRLEMEGFSHTWIGVITSALYIGIFIGSFRLDRYIAKLGLSKSFLYCSGVLTLCVLLQAVWLDPIYWSVLRFIAGICTAGVFIIIESWLLIQATETFRGVILSIYLAIFYLAMTLGQLLINVSDPKTITPILLTALLSFLSMVPLVVKKSIEPQIANPVRMSPKELFKTSPFGLSGVFISGILLAAMYGFVPIYGKQIGLSFSEIGNLMALLIFGGLLFQWPAGKIADSGKRKQVLYISALLSCISAIVIAISGHLDTNILFLQIFLLGGFSFAIYPLSMAYACETIKEEQLVSATSGFVLSYGIGAMMGPLMAPVAMIPFGSCGLFYFIGFFSLLLCAIGHLSKTKQTIKN